MQEDEIPATHLPGHARQVGGQDGLVELPLLLAEAAGVADRTAEEVVHALGDPEERRTAVEDHRVRVDARTGSAGEKCEHLRDAVSGGGRLHIPHRPVAEHPAAALGIRPQAFRAVRFEQECEPLQRRRLVLQPPNCHLGHAAAYFSTPDFQAAQRVRGQPLGRPPGMERGPNAGNLRST